jgi:hypothetical protein
MALDMAQLRAAFKNKSEVQGEGSGNTGFWDKFFPFYKMNFDEVTSFRFLPDGNEDNPLGFIVENTYHELLINGKKKKFGCLKMHDGKTANCPLCTESKKHYDAGDTALGKSFWKKTDYVAQGVIINTPMEYPIKDDENPVRLVSLSKSLYEKIEHAIVSGDLDSMPFDEHDGYDFRIEKVKKSAPGGKEFGDYSNSSFARRSTPIPPDLATRIEKYDLSKYRFQRIEPEQMEAAIEAFLTGKDFDENKEKSTQQKVEDGASKPMQDAGTVMAAAAATTQATSAPPADGATAKLSPQEILAKLKARQSQG